MLRNTNTSRRIDKEIAKAKLWLYLHEEDVVGFLKTFIPVILLMILMVKIPFLYRHYELKKLDSITVGKIKSIEKIIGIHESEEGGKLYTKSYRIDYQYTIGEEHLNSVEFIPRASCKPAMIIKLNQLEKGDSLSILYDSRNHKRSRVSID